MRVGVGVAERVVAAGFVDWKDWSMRCREKGELVVESPSDCARKLSSLGVVLLTSNQLGKAGGSVNYRVTEQRNNWI